MLERYGDNYYYYNEEGIRIAKEENGLIHKYYVEDNVIHKEEIRNKSSNQLVKEIYYYYDETGISAFRINSNIYYYLKDCQYFSKMSQTIKNISRNYNLLFCCTCDHNKQSSLNDLMISTDGWQQVQKLFCI